MLHDLAIALIALIAFAFGAAFGVHLESWWRDQSDDDDEDPPQSPA